jgi:hypothetical protein
MLHPIDGLRSPSLRHSRFDIATVLPSHTHLLYDLMRMFSGLRSECCTQQTAYAAQP